MKIKKISQSKIYFIIFSLIITITCLIKINDMQCISLLNDEFGYWSTATYTAGFNWKNLIQLTPYYSPIYGLFLLPLIYISSNSQIWYQLSIIENIFFLIASYFVLIKLGILYFGEKEKKKIIFISFLAIFVPTNLIYSQFSWTENLLLLCYCLMTYEMTRYFKDQKLKNFLIGLCVGGIVVLLHPRGQFIYFVYLFIFAIYLLNIKEYKNLAILLGLGLFFILGEKLVKELAIDIYWNNSSSSNINNISINSESINSYFSSLLKDPKLFIISLLGKLDVSFFISGFTLLIPLRRLYQMIKKTLKLKFTVDYRAMSLCWMYLSFFAMVILSSVNTLYWQTRKDLIVYSRYFDFTLIPLIVIGLGYYLINIRKETKPIMIGLFFSIFISPYILSKIYEIPGGFNIICSPNFGFLTILFDNWIDASKFIVIILLLWTLFILIAYKKSFNKNIIFFFLLLICLSNGIIYNQLSEQTFKNRENEKLGVENIESYITTKKVKNIAYLYNPESETYPTYIKYLQFRIPKLYIQVVENIKDIERSELNEQYILVPKLQEIDNLENFIKVSETKSLVLFKKKIT